MRRKRGASSLLQRQRQRQRQREVSSASSMWPSTFCASGLLFVLASLLCSMMNCMVDAAHPQRLVKDFLEDGTPIWRYVDLPPLERALDSMDGNLSDHESDYDQTNKDADVDVDEDDYDASYYRNNARRDLRELQSNGCPSSDGSYTYTFTQDIYITLYDIDREMRPGEQRVFEERVKRIWNDPNNSCFAACFVIDTVTVIQQTIFDYDDDSTFVFVDADSQDDRRDLLEEEDENNINNNDDSDFALTLEAALSGDDEGEEEANQHRRLDPGHRAHRRRKGKRKGLRTRARADGRCRSACRQPIKARDRRLHEIEEDQRIVDIFSDGQISDYFRALDERDDYYQPAHRRLFACEELLQKELQDIAINYRGVGQSAFNCLSSLRVSTSANPDDDYECIHTPHSRTHRSSVSGKGKGDRQSRASSASGKGKGDRQSRAASSASGKGKGGGYYDTYRTQSNYNYAKSKASKGGGGYYGGNYRTSYYASKASKGSF